ncbi:MAG TPA: ribose 5-phosphate isomerase B [Dictyoglomaceae bacterium]|nr:ribose 5-phosphate isomerase B [Dictyoglomaceae bacterium]HOL39734.1 ribose 5-phosphate isomerase B [Dictyoglomaceae bacterium]HPP16133.1 ribose 5-phosphate isomerase B [Dictyoglomaceae bacterium]HPU43901.1 ribose 5-phosphate isomerase B [Dictyoglomaceae bacterium]
MKIAIGADHAGYTLKEQLKSWLEEWNISYHDFGTYSPESVDYPDYGILVARAVARGGFEKGIVICGTGIGMSIVANKVKGVRAAVCRDPYEAKLSREHNDANILALGGRILGTDLAKEIVRVWLNTEFTGGRHKLRVQKISMIEEEEL